MAAVIICILPALAVFLADQILKRHSRRWYQGGRQKTFGRPPAALTFRYLRNYGMALGAGARRPGVIKWGSVCLIAVVIALYVYILGFDGFWLTKSGVALLLGGAVSNTYDRFHDGYVTDYFSFCFGPAAFRRVVFNLGDCAIMIGAILTLLGAWM